MKSNVLNQYKPECREALNSTAKLSKTFEKVFMDAMPLYMAISPQRGFNGLNVPYEDSCVP